MTNEYEDPDAPAGYAVLVQLWKKPDPYFQNRDKLKPVVPSYLDPWRVAPDDSRVPTHETARTRDCLVAVYPNAIAVGSPHSLSIGLPGSFTRMVVWFFIVIFPIGMGLANLNLFWADIGDPWTWPLLLLNTSLFLPAIWGFNAIVRTPADWPILFNRKDRTVTFIRPARPKLFKFWQFTDSGVYTESWDTLKLRTYKMEVRYSRTFWMVLQWGEPNKDGLMAVKDYVSIGYQAAVDEHLFQVWEHVRRYMEEDGPSILRGERLRKPVNNRTSMPFPPDVIAAAGGPALSAAEVERLSGLEPAAPRQASAATSA